MQCNILILSDFSFKQIRTEGMMRSKFDTLYLAFNDWLIAPEAKKSKDGIKMWLCQPGFLKVFFSVFIYRKHVI